MVEEITDRNLDEMKTIFNEFPDIRDKFMFGPRIDIVSDKVVGDAAKKRRRDKQIKTETEARSIIEANIAQFMAYETTASDDDESGTATYPCADCEMCFSTGGHLWRHYSRRHATYYSPHQCQECDKKFARIYTLMAHVKAVHQSKSGAALPFECAQCGRRLARKSILTAHVRRHTGEKPFACADCGRRFTDAAHRDTHQRGVHSTARPFACVQCGARFKYHAAHSQHMRVHSGQSQHPCEVCGRVFTQRTAMRTHMASHQRVKRSYVCDECSATFTRVSRLLTHLLTHREARPFACAHCRRRFARNCSRIDHERRHLVTETVTLTGTRREPRKDVKRDARMKVARRLRSSDASAEDEPSQQHVTDDTKRATRIGVRRLRSSDVSSAETRREGFNSATKRATRSESFKDARVHGACNGRFGDATITEDACDKPLMDVNTPRRTLIDERLSSSPEIKDDLPV